MIYINYDSNQPSTWNYSKAVIHTEQINGQPTDKNRPLAVIQSRFPNGSILTASGQSVLANRLAMTAN